MYCNELNQNIKNSKRVQFYKSLGGSASVKSQTRPAEHFYNPGWKEGTESDSLPSQAGSLRSVYLPLAGMTNSFFVNYPSRQILKMIRFSVRRVLKVSHRRRQ